MLERNNIFNLEFIIHLHNGVCDIIGQLNEMKIRWELKEFHNLQFS